MSEEQFREFFKQAVQEHDEELPASLDHYLVNDKVNEEEKFKQCVNEFEQLIHDKKTEPQYLSLEVYERLIAQGNSFVIMSDKFTLISLEVSQGIINATEQPELMQFMKAYAFHDSLVKAIESIKTEEVHEVILKELYFEKRAIAGALERIYEKYSDAKPKQD